MRALFEGTKHPARVSEVEDIWLASADKTLSQNCGTGVSPVSTPPRQQCHSGARMAFRHSETASGCGDRYRGEESALSSLATGESGDLYDRSCSAV